MNEPFLRSCDYSIVLHQTDEEPWFGLVFVMESLRAQAGLQFLFLLPSPPKCWCNSYAPVFLPEEPFDDPLGQMILALC